MSSEQHLQAIDNDKCKSIIDIMPQQVWTARPSGELVYVNQQTTTYFGKPLAYIVGMGWQVYVHPDDLDNCVMAWNKSLQTGRPYEMEFRLLNADGAYHWHLGRAQPLLKDGIIVEWFGTNTDIDVYKDNEAKKDEFINVASHELKTPLTSAKGYLQLAQHVIEPNSPSKKFVEKALQPFLRLEKLINDLLDVSKINAGKLNYTFGNVDFEELLRESVESVQHTTPTHNIVIETNETVLIKGDKLRIEQVINNFLSNAIKYSPQANKIIVRSVRQQNNLIVSVQDFGIGIEEKDLGQLFNRYYRTDNASSKYEGMGLGLYISAEIIKRHNGSFWIESEQGNGATFYCLFPINGKQEIVDYETDNQTFYKGNFLEMYYDEANKWIYVDWLGYQNFESVKKGCLIMLGILQKNNCSKVLNDNSHVMGNWSEAADWGSTTWFPAMENAGLRQFAWIYSPSAFSRMSAQKSVDVRFGKMTAQFFTEKEKAINWLKEVQ